MSKKHPYLKLRAKQRPAYLMEQTPDDLILLKHDLDYLGEACPELEQALTERGLHDAVGQDHLLPAYFFERDPRPRRLPNKAEYGWKCFLFFAFKYSLVVALLIGPMVAIGGETLGLAVGLPLMMFCLIVPMVCCWTNPFYRPLRYTLIRPFNADEFSKPLKRFLVRNIGLRCHGYTLSDRRFKPNLVLTICQRFLWEGAWMTGGALAGYALIVSVIFTWSKQSVRIKTIMAPSGFTYLSKEFVRTRFRSFQHFVCGGQCFNIRTVTAAWKYAMQALMYEADFMIVDLSYVKAGSHWEIELLQTKQRTTDCIAVCQQGYEDDSQRYAHLFDKIIYYDARGRIVGDDDVVESIRSISQRQHQERQDALSFN
jgi:hypothetical protein